MSIENEKVKNIIEAALFAANKPMSIDLILGLFDPIEQPGRSDVQDLLKTIEDEYQQRGIELKQVSTGYRFQVRQQYSEWVSKLWEEKPSRYSRALLETLALVAYRQPITRAEIEDVRGVAVSTNIMKTLQERDWVKVVGHRDVPGRPALFATTKEFLDYFNLKSMDELPTLAEIKDLDKISEALTAGADIETPEVKSEGEVHTEVHTEVDTEVEAKEQDIEDQVEVINDTDIDADEDEIKTNIEDTDVDNIEFSSVGTDVTDQIIEEETEAEVEAKMQDIEDQVEVINDSDEDETHLSIEASIEDTDIDNIEFSSVEPDVTDQIVEEETEAEVEDEIEEKIQNIEDQVEAINDSDEDETISDIENTDDDNIALNSLEENEPDQIIDQESEIDESITAIGEKLDSELKKDASIDSDIEDIEESIKKNKSSEYTSASEGTLLN